MLIKMKQSSKLFDILERLAVSTWRRTFESSQRIKGWLLKATLVLSGHLTKECAIASFLFAKEVLKIYRRSGPLFCALYLKQCSSCLQTAYGGIKHKPFALPIYVSLTRSGYPVIIPSFHRKMILRRDDKGDFLVKLYLSWFSLAKLVRLCAPVSNATFKSIITPVEDDQKVMDVVSELSDRFKSIIDTYMPWISSIPVKQGFRWVPTWKALPNPSRRNKECKKNLFLSYHWELSAFGTIHQLAHATEKKVNVIWFTMVSIHIFCVGLPFRVTTMFSEYSYQWFSSYMGPLIPTAHADFKGIPICYGRLAALVEGGGKRRIIAIGNYFKQRLLRPYHDWMMKVLTRLPNDGTYNQTGPIRFLRNIKDLYSYDLKSATDRWPLTLLFCLMRCLFGPSLASSIVQTTLGHNVFDVPFVKKDFVVCFVAGQPLGYYLSWPLFALSHHVVVWMAAARVFGPSYRFKAYAVLGDDVVIGDSRVAKEYASILSDLQVTISYQKSLVSDIGACEFAKRFYVKGCTVDLSPVSIKSLFACNSLIGLLMLRDR